MTPDPVREALEAVAENADEIMRQHDNDIDECWYVQQTSASLRGLRAALAALDAARANESKAGAEESRASALGEPDARLAPAHPPAPAPSPAVQAIKRELAKQEMPNFEKFVSRDEPQPPGAVSAEERAQAIIDACTGGEHFDGIDYLLVRGPLFKRIVEAVRDAEQAARAEADVAAEKKWRSWACDEEGKDWASWKARALAAESALAAAKAESQRLREDRMAAVVAADALGLKPAGRSADDIKAISAEHAEAIVQRVVTARHADICKDDAELFSKVEIGVRCAIKEALAAAPDAGPKHDVPALLREACDLFELESRPHRDLAQRLLNAADDIEAARGAEGGR